MAGSYNIVVKQGDTFNFSCVISTDGVPWNLTGYTCKLQVRKSASSTTKELNLSDTSGMTLSSVGKITATASSTLMTAISTGRLVYDLEVTSAGGEKTTLLSGRFIVSTQVSA